MTVADGAGRLVGLALAPITGLVAALRRSRMFHPHGIVTEAEVVADPAEPELAPLAARVAGPALARLSSAWWKNEREWTDALGLAVRLRARDTVDARPEPGDQDLLLATIRRPYTTPLAPLTTRVSDFLANDYYGVSPFLVDDFGRVYLRARSARPGSDAPSRRARLEHDVAAGRAVLDLELAAGPRGPWRRFARLRLTRVVAGVDQAALRFDPFRAGRGIRPTGFVHAIRRAAYAASQALRPA